MIKRMVSLIILITVFVLFSSSSEICPEVFRLAPGVGQPAESSSGYLLWPTELIGEKLPAFSETVDFIEQNETEIIISSKVVSYENFLKYVDEFVNSGVGENTFNKNIIPYKCIFFAKSVSYNAKIYYYSDESMPKYNMVIVYYL